MRSRRKIDILDVHQTIWRCRDFELTYLWQRSIFLTAFLVLCYTGYGFLLFEILKEPIKQLSKEESNVFKVSNLNMQTAAILIAIVGLLFSSLWIKMAKGSKAWYEKYEKAIYAMESDSSFIEKKAMVVGAFQYEKMKNYKSEMVNSCLFSMSGGCYSPSKINIAIGQVSFIVWLPIIIYHLRNIFISDQDVKLRLYVLCILLLFVLIFIINKSWVKSTAIKETKRYRCLKYFKFGFGLSIFEFRIYFIKRKKI